MLDLAERLVAAGFGYAVHDGTVYYEVARFHGYGQLSGNSLEALHAGHRSEVDSHKRDPADFALWRAAGEGRELKWPSPWGDGFPGWHLECSAMALRYLGAEFDIHSGGIDNVFPHHEDEIAQSAAVTGRVPARHWLHGEFLLAEGLKMAKSAGNFVRITDLVDAGVDPLAFRYLTFTARYGHKLNLSSESLAAAGAALDSLRGRLRALGPPPEAGPWAAPPVLSAGRASDRPIGIASGVAGQGGDGREYPLLDRASADGAPLSRAGRHLHDRFVAAVDDDLDLPTAVAVIRETLRSDVPTDERRWLVLDADAILGLDLAGVWSIPDDATETDLSADESTLMARRAEARRARDFATADHIRDELMELGLELTDGPDGATTWRRVVRS
jgi:cysteinyl-tRNA synthetase